MGDLRLLSADEVVDCRASGVGTDPSGISQVIEKHINSAVLLLAPTLLVR